MSYTSYSGKPDDLMFKIIANVLFAEFTCPRCKNRIAIEIDPNSLVYELELICDHPACKAVDERYGYQLFVSMDWLQSLLSVNDRPLHQ